MNATENHIPVRRTARYFTLGQPAADIQRIWYVIHGYGQLAEHFIRHFEPIVAADTLVVAPEALSRFYVEGFYGRVGASWMTREDRLTEIADQLSYLDTLHDSIAAQCAPAAEVTVLGFSQGTATSWRWQREGRIRPANYVIWAGSVPKETDPEWEARLRAMQLHIAVGTEDQFISPEAAQKQITAMQTRFPDLQAHSFEGKHQLDADTLQKIDRQLRS